MSTPQASPPVAFTDTETDGVYPERRAWEVAMIRREDGVDTEVSFFVEIDLSTADLFGLQVGRFYERHPLGRWLSGRSDYEDYPDPDDKGTEYVSTWEAAHRVARYTHGAHLVGAVPHFDAEVLAPLLRFWELVPSWHYHLIDIEAMAVGYIVGHYGTRDQAEAEAEAVALPWSSDELSRACGVEPPGDDERHTALGDARWAARLYDAMTSRGAP